MDETVHKCTGILHSEPRIIMCDEPRDGKVVWLGSIIEVLKMG